MSGDTTTNIKPLRVLVACEFSGVVRRAFQAKGHDAWSCDLLPAEDGEPDYGNGGKHYRCDVRMNLNDGYNPPWDMIIAHPPCTHLSVSGARWFKDKKDEQREAIDFFLRFLQADCKYLCIENPVSIMSTVYRKPDQVIQPFQFGDPFRKTTCLWLKGLPKLIPTSDMKTGEQACWKMPPSPDRAKNRSRTYQGIAKAMADQWGGLAA